MHGYNISLKVHPYYTELITYVALGNASFIVVIESTRFKLCNICSQCIVINEIIDQK